ncbi:MAG: hypothetical protein RLZ98_1153 [Pseudomonadota bacterium]|jgi:pentatricopeptide repeat protein
MSASKFPQWHLVRLACVLLAGLFLGNDAFAQQKGKTIKTDASGDLAERVQQLEAQLVEMRIVIDTLDSLAKRGPGAASQPSSGGFGGDTGGNARIDVLETQVRALTSQIEQLAGEVRALSGTGRASGGAAASQPVTGWQTQSQGGGSAWQPNAQPPSRSFGPEVRGYDSRTGSPAAAGTSADANRSYLQAINLYNQDDFKGARDALTVFVGTHPSHPQIPTAQFRLAQSNYKLGQYTVAAKQFWSLVKAFPQEPVAPDSFAMFAASLGRAGRPKDACEAFQQMRARYPSDAAHMPPEAKAEKLRLRCQ